jgi:hypothetical protein
MFEFVTCPICSGHEKLSAEAAHELERMLQVWLDKFDGFGTKEPALVAEMTNIRNVILNRAERRPKKSAIDPLLL